MTNLADQLSALSKEQLIAMIEAAKKQQTSRITFKVSPKGALCVYGLGKFPVTLYASQWERLLDQADAIRAFAKANADKLTTKA